MNIHQKRHGLSHILAQAVQRIKGADIQLGIGPDIENGFYYDFDTNFVAEDLPVLQKSMEKIIKENQDFNTLTLDISQAKELIKKLDQNYKLELAQDLADQGEKSISFYINTIAAASTNAVFRDESKEYISRYEDITKILSSYMDLSGKFVTFVDMCAGPHVDKTSDIQIGTFGLDKIAGAYWKGSEKNKMMTRIYGYAFDTKEEYKEHLNFLEEAKKRDHRVLGQKLQLFTFSDKVGLGLPLWMPKGAMLWKQIEDFWKEAHEKNGYEFVRTPHIGNKTLWETSGHWGFYADSMYPPMEVGQTLEEAQKGEKVKESEVFLLKPMNCPFHVEIYNTLPKSYRDFPLRWAETGTVYRFEKKGQLGGLTRVRGFTQDDAHIICRADQVEDELKRVVNFILYIFETFGFDKKSVKVFLSLRDPNNKEKYAGNDQGWDFTEKTLEKVAKEMELDYTKEEGEAAFYGPKLDFKLKDVLGRLWQCSTLQFDFNLPERFDMKYVNKDGEFEKPYMLHRALFGSFERFIGILIEHYAGAFPLWLSPEQVRIIPVADKFVDYADKVYAQMKEQMIRATVDDSADSFSKKIRNAELDKVPYIIIVGEKEEGTDTLSIREFKTKNQSEASTKDFIARLLEEISSRII